MSVRHPMDGYPYLQFFIFMWQIVLGGWMGYSRKNANRVIIIIIIVIIFILCTKKLVFWIHIYNIKM